ncbi:unnamed protein product [Polarella glacialis]|uniref:Uncharacterized protein n=1 Tax=Polarella glacialis TaxID=89957 RepID=A0A813EX45_POLGL|nr:unnamed protein product [Polarella glacialis]CAE8734991.1 unnamed protein product [Polarella glacialis]
MRTVCDASATSAPAGQPVKIGRFVVVKEFLCGSPACPATAQSAAVEAPEDPPVSKDEILPLAHFFVEATEENASTCCGSLVLSSWKTGDYNTLIHSSSPMPCAFVIRWLLVP